MGRKLDLGELQDSECEHILEVINRDFKLRQLETERLQQHEKELKEEALKTALLEKQRAFNKESTCIRCLETFPVLAFFKLSICTECNYNVCRACSEYDKVGKKWTCTACVKSRDLRVQTLTWFYDDVKTRFRRFGSAKVVRSLYKRKSGGPNDPDDDSGCDPSQSSTVPGGLAKDIILEETTPDASSVPLDGAGSSNGGSSILDQIDFPEIQITPTISRHIEAFNEDSGSTIEELREALADFLTDDDFESDRFKRMLYTFSLKFAGIVKTLSDSLEEDIKTEDGSDTTDLSRRVTFKQVDSLMGVSLGEPEELRKTRHEEELDQYVGQVMVYKVMNDFKQEAADFCAGFEGEEELEDRLQGNAA